MLEIVKFWYVKITSKIYENGNDFMDNLHDHELS